MRRLAVVAAHALWPPRGRRRTPDPSASSVGGSDGRGGPDPTGAAAKPVAPSGHAPHDAGADWPGEVRGSHPEVQARTPLVVYEPGPPAARVAPTEPLGPWALGSLERILRGADPGSTLTLDLGHAPITLPSHVATVLWADDVAGQADLTLEVLVPDPISAELLDFAGVRGPVYTSAERPARASRVRPAS